MENQNDFIGGKEYSQLCDMEMVLFNLSRDVERAECVLQDVTDEYFNIDVNDPDEFWKIRACHQEHKTRADIAFDYLHKMDVEISAAMKVIRVVIDELKQERAAVAV